jgi:antitoxin MazE
MLGYPSQEVAMSQAVVGRWGKNLAVRVPAEVARASGLHDGEKVRLETQDGDILIRRFDAHARRRSDAEAAAAEIMADSKARSLDFAAIRDLLADGRRG